MWRITSKTIRSPRARGDRNTRRLPRSVAACALAAGLFVAAGQPLASTAGDPFAWLRPAINVDAAMRDRLDNGETVSHVLPSPDAQIGVFAATRLDADPARLEEWAASIADLKKSRFVLAVRRFSDPPVLDDLQDLELDADDIEALRSCVPGDCPLKMSAADVESLRQALEGGGHASARAQQEFRRIVLNHVNAYHADGFAGLAPYVDHRRPIDPIAVFASLFAASPYLRTGPIADLSARTAAFFYWSKEQYGAGKPVITVTHVDIVRADAPSALRVAVVGKEIFATHYRNGSLGLTAVTEDGDGHRYLVYVNRSQLDVLGGVFGGLKRSIVEGRLKGESVKVLTDVRARLESGPPPHDVSPPASRSGAPPDQSPVQ